MALDFEVDNLDKVIRSGTPVPGYPLTIAAWFNAESTSNLAIMTILEAAVSNNYFQLVLRPGGEVGAVARNPNFEVAVTTTNYSTGTWHHGAAVFTSSSAIAAYIDGGSEGTLNPGQTPDNLDRTSIGVLDRPSPSDHFDGRLAEIAVWDVALSTAELAVLAAGFSPLFVRPASLVLYVPLVRDVLDYKDSSSWTITGTAVASHPRIIYPSSPQTRPTVLTPRVITPPTLALALSTFAPVVLTPRVVIPPTLPLALTTFAPTINVVRLIIPGTLALTLSTFPPTVLTPRVVIPPTLALTLSTFAPLVRVALIVTPGVLALILTTFAPTPVISPKQIGVTGADDTGIAATGSETAPSATGSEATAISVTGSRD